MRDGRFARGISHRGRSLPLALIVGVIEGAPPFDWARRRGATLHGVAFSGHATKLTNGGKDSSWKTRWGDDAHALLDRVTFQTLSRIAALASATASDSCQ